MATIFFHSLQNFLNGNEFANFEAIQMAIDEFFASKDETFFIREINKLPENHKLAEGDI